MRSKILASVFNLLYSVQMYFVYLFRIVASGSKLQQAVVQNTAKVYLFENTFDLSYDRVSNYTLQFQYVLVSVG